MVMDGAAMEDIEDVIIRPTSLNPNSERPHVTVRKRLKGNDEQFHGDSFVPGTQKIYVRTWGCTHNTSDSEQMAGLLSAAGHQLTNKKEDASLWILNSCTVKTPSETQLENAVKEAQQRNKFVIVAGCVSQAEPNLSYLKGISIVGVKQIECIVQAVEETLKGNCVRFLSRRKPNSNLLLPKIRKNKYIEILAISNGCLNHCTYCKTKSARGNLVSYPLDGLLERAQNAFADGCKEIWLTSEDLGAWGRDIGMVLPDLLNAVVEIIPEGCMLRLGMTNPPYILDFLEDIAKVLNHPRVYSFLHIPVQSASDAVLSDMKREYACADFNRVVDFMIQNVPDVYIATDFICAYPTETVDDFEESMTLVRKYRFPSVFINQFYPRTGTPAASMKKIDTIEARRRTAKMSALFRSYSRYGKERIGEVHRVLVCELATDRLHYVGHNKFYEHILIASKKCLLGSWVNVQVVDVSKFHMKAVLMTSDSVLLDGFLKTGILALTSNYWLTAFSTILSVFILWLLLL